MGSRRGGERAGVGQVALRMGRGGTAHGARGRARAGHGGVSSLHCCWSEKVTSGSKLQGVSLHGSNRVPNRFLGGAIRVLE